jgi:hypothetical protein
LCQTAIAKSFCCALFQVAVISRVMDRCNDIVQ